ncbi:helix-turn-helix domain-containing protein [Halomarina salina]|uniref:Helix-turn-helix domain-containing protein n=1 Tax=Halomarina salina TaxID=1872699 RepID=A0ABD5RMM1_9EURY|nr:helix-turn-helix domain-containing protein [Halomarina salina]
MRYFRAVVIPDDEGLHPIDRAFARAPDVTRQLLHNVNLLEDGTAMTMYQLSGDVDTIRDICDSPDVYEYHLAEGPDSVTLYAHFEPTETIAELLSLFQHHQLILDTPLEYTERGGLRVLVIGTEETIRSIMPEIPDEVTLKLERLGDYEPEADRLYSMLTPRQQETLQAALEVGYYQVPREATHEDIARELGLTGGTVGEHLRKIEATVLSAITPR